MKTSYWKLSYFRIAIKIRDFSRDWTETQSWKFGGGKRVGWFVVSKSMGEHESVEKYKVVVVVVVIVVVEKRSNEPVAKFFTSVADEPLHDTWRKGCRIIDREKCFTYFPVVYRRTMSPATRARGQKRRTNERSPLFREGENRVRARDRSPRVRANLHDRVPRTRISPFITLHMYDAVCTLLYRLRVPRPVASLLHMARLGMRREG